MGILRRLRPDFKCIHGRTEGGCWECRANAKALQQGRPEPRVPGQGQYRNGRKVAPAAGGEPDRKTPQKISGNGRKGRRR